MIATFGPIYDVVKVDWTFGVSADAAKPAIAVKKRRYKH
jgi:hypothetical protein